MAYYGMGDYYAGSMGDPGLLGPVLGLVKRGAMALAKRTPIGTAVTLGAGAVGMGVKAFSGTGPRPLPRPGSIQITPGAFLPGGPPLISRSGEQRPSGYHLDKKTGTRWVRNRSMNPANPRALRRAIRREKSFIGLAKRALKGTGITISRRSIARKS